jgi:predicted ester cyclase
VTFHGTHQGPFNGIAATGKQVEWSGIAMDRIANGKVIEMWHVQNTTGLMRQIGATSPAASVR